SAWLLWCQGQGVTTPLAESCPCQVTGLELRVQAPALLVHELRGRRSGSVSPEWLVLGAGPVRRAVTITVIAALLNAALLPADQFMFRGDVVASERPG